MSNLPARRNETTVIENARILFRNFAGKTDRFGQSGKRTFVVVLEDDLANQLIDQGYNIKYLKPRDEDDTPTPILRVTVNFGGRPPRMFLISSRGRTPVGEDLAELMDWVDVDRADITINPYRWHVNGNDGTTAYLQTIFMHIVEDPLEMKYADVEIISFDGAGKAIESGNDPLALPWGDEGDIVDAEIIED